MPNDQCHICLSSEYVIQCGQCGKQVCAEHRYSIKSGACQKCEDEYVDRMIEEERATEVEMIECPDCGGHKYDLLIGLDSKCEFCNGNGKLEYTDEMRKQDQR